MITRPEKLMLVFLDMLGNGDAVMAVTKQAVADAFAREFPADPPATNEEVVGCFMRAYDEGYIDVESIGGKAP